MTPEKVTPKFKVGTLLVNNGDGDRGEVVAVGKTHYLIGYFVDNQADVYSELSEAFEDSEKWWSERPKEVTITREKLAEAWDGLCFEKYGLADSENSPFFSDLCKELGL